MTAMATVSSPPTLRPAAVKFIMVLVLWWFDGYLEAAGHGGDGRCVFDSGENGENEKRAESHKKN